jgi:hypothetical protein
MLQQISSNAVQDCTYLKGLYDINKDQDRVKIKGQIKGQVLGPNTGSGLRVRNKGKDLA